jgi:PilZ domain
MIEAMNEKRIAPRHRVFKHGVLAFNDGGSVDCTVRNLSATGARIDVFNPIGLPDNFVLVIESDHFSRQCHSVWSRDKQIGVAFD